MKSKLVVVNRFCKLCGRERPGQDGCCGQAFAVRHEITVEDTDSVYKLVLNKLITTLSDFGYPEDFKMTGHCDLQLKTDTHTMTSIAYHLGVSSNGMECQDSNNAKKETGFWENNSHYVSHFPLKKLGRDLNDHKELIAMKNALVYLVVYKSGKAKFCTKVDEQHFVLQQLI